VISKTTGALNLTTHGRGRRQYHRRGSQCAEHDAPGAEHRRLGQMVNLTARPITLGADVAMRRIICTHFVVDIVGGAGPRWKECVADGCRRHRIGTPVKTSTGTSGLFLISSGVGVAGNIDVQEANALTTGEYVKTDLAPRSWSNWAVLR